MSYVDQSRSPSPTSMVAVVAVHAAMAAALVVGLTVTGVIKTEDGPLITITPNVPPPPPAPVDDPAPADPVKTTVSVPTPPLDLKTKQPTFETNDIFPPLPYPDPGPTKIELPKPTPSATTSFAPVAAKPRNDPGGWLSDADYRSSWARKEMVGTARFRLEIAANGKIMGCQITGSTGYPEMDAATCALVSKRAKFEPARGGEGEPVAGSYNGSVRWQLPE